MPVSFKIVPNGKGSRTAATSAMHPYGLEIIENCVTRPHREDRLFCDLSSPALLRLSEITSASSYPKGATLFVEGQSPRGVFILLAGRVKTFHIVDRRENADRQDFRTRRSAGTSGHYYWHILRAHRSCSRVRADEFHIAPRFSWFSTRTRRGFSPRGSAIGRVLSCRHHGNAFDWPLALGWGKAGAVSS